MHDPGDDDTPTPEPKKAVARPIPPTTPPRRKWPVLRMRTSPAAKKSPANDESSEPAGEEDEG